MAISYQYNASGHYVSEGEDNGFPPNNSTYDAPPKKPWGQKWPLYASEKWVLVEDHRERKPPYFLEEFTQEATKFWLSTPFGEDDWQSQARMMKDAGPLPKGYTLTHPEKPLSVAQAEKQREINAAHGEVLSYLLTESPNPTPVESALAVEDMRADDPDGLTYVRALVDARRAELLAAVAAATTVAEVESIAVRYPV